MSDSLETTPVWFYPYATLRETQLDTIRLWPGDLALNRDQRLGTKTVMAGSVASPAPRRSGWHRHLPLPNVKFRPAGLPPDAAVFVWGAVLATGPFITELENPYALTGYDLRAMPLWRWLLRWTLLQQRCLEVRCMSEACRKNLAIELGEQVASKARVVYPKLPSSIKPRRRSDAGGPRFVFISTQFEIKGGAALLRAFAQVRAVHPDATLDLITHLPDERRALAAQPGVRWHVATMSRDEIWEGFLADADVLVHPTYIDSFGLVVLEALAHGLAVVATDVYAIGEMVQDGVNGHLLPAPLSMWDGYRPNALFSDLKEAPSLAAHLDTKSFEQDLARAMIEIGQPDRLEQAKRASRRLYEEKFAGAA
jgi:glycosyltransferase involved in cell wall biosynthesis